MIRQCLYSDFQNLYEIINDAAQAYKGVIPPDLWHTPYMSKDDLRAEIDNGVDFWGYEERGELLGVMGIQDVKDVTLIRHAYVLTSRRNKGIGTKIIQRLQNLTTRPILVGAWADVAWAVKFYEKNGFTLVSTDEKDRLLKKYWSIPERQIETSVVLVDKKWRDRPAR